MSESDGGYVEVKKGEKGILTINAGSSSIKFSVYTSGVKPERMWHGKVDRIGQGGEDFKSAASSLVERLEKEEYFASVVGVGHRIVHGMKHTEPEIVTPELMKELHGIEAYDPDHMPGGLQLITAFLERHPKLPQVACFDTAFHRTMPRVAKIVPVPRRYEAKGLERYGFHGLSYAYLMEELARVAGKEVAEGRVVLCHFGNGASLAAVLGGKCIDTSMGFTPTAGLPMSTRTGDLDPGVASFMERTEGMSGKRFYEMANHESGLLGVSETSSDMRDLLEHEGSDERAAEAVALFCYQAKKWIGAYAAALGGIETLVFAGGIGENAAPVRERVCAGLGFLGIEVDGSRNSGHADVISTDASRVTVRVMKTNEELMIARSVFRIIK